MYARNSVSLADLNLALFSFSDLTVTIKAQRATMRHTFLIIIIFWLIGTGRLLSLRETERKLWQNSRFVGASSETTGGESDQGNQTGEISYHLPSPSSPSLSARQLY